jgi:Ca2+-binding RTX toxin-like protein
VRQRTATALVVVSALALLGPASASGDNTLKCFGERATIVGSGLITGTEGDDVIVGSDGDDTINALGGNDSVCALGGNDLSRGGLGDDHLDGGEGNDGHLGDVNADLPGTDQPGGNDVIIGGPGDDSAAGDHRSFSGARHHGRRR